MSTSMSDCAQKHNVQNQMAVHQAVSRLQGAREQLEAARALIQFDSTGSIESTLPETATVEPESTGSNGAESIVEDQEVAPTLYRDSGVTFSVYQDAMVTAVKCVLEQGMSRGAAVHHMWEALVPSQ